MPDELFATTPPSVHAPSLAGSGPSLRPYAARRALTWRIVAPGPTRTRAPSPSTSTRRKWRRVSARIPPVTAWPDRLVPPERNVSGTPVRRAVANSLPTSVGVARDHDRLRGEHEVRGVVGVGEPVGGAGADVVHRVGQAA